MGESPPKHTEKGAATPSPITAIARGLLKSSLSSEKCKQRYKRRTDESRHIEDPLMPCPSEHSGGSNAPKQVLFKDAFKFKTTPENQLKFRARGRRLLGMTSRRFLGPEQPGSPSVEKENSNAGRSPRGTSPQKMPQAVKKCRFPLEDCDPNSQDSGYDACYVGKEEKPRDMFRFVEPMAVAPRRMSIESRSPIESPIRSSPRVCALQQSPLFRTMSSGYESLDDGFNELDHDVETLEDSRVSQNQFPNGISNLICGDIVGISPASDVSSASKMDTTISPNTPELPRTRSRTGNFRRSLFLQNEQTESGENFSLSKVRSCLFHSPSASPTSSVSELGYIDSPLMGTKVSPTSFASIVPASHRQRLCFRDIASSSSNSIANSMVSPLSVRSFKRPDPPINDSPKLVKRSRKSESDFFNTLRQCCASDASTSIPPFAGLSLHRSLSETSGTIAVMETTNSCAGNELEIETESHALIESAIHRSTTDADLIGDFSKRCILPLTVGRHENLKSISTDTLGALIRGEFNDRVDSFRIVDCRYPYEFEAGHIQGAVNLYNKDQIIQNLLDPLTGTPKIQPESNKRNILVFHCEFSWERGPNLSRFLRSLDRERNKEHYPALHYPEVYLLHGGYQQFFNQQRELCSPQGYRPMRHPDHEADLRIFRNKSKSWQGEKSRITGSTSRTLKRLGF